ncbi:MAG TPA: PqqD family peptide modification chaperone [Pyrinomonadaceae bacterium]|nr:PqqD family peptide modification chaperone [Pyrinomonadaceae bacterium]
MKNVFRLPRARSENLVIRELDDETLVYDMERDEAHCLNQTAALVWQRCDGRTTATRLRVHSQPD